MAQLEAAMVETRQRLDGLVNLRTEFGDATRRINQERMEFKDQIEKSFASVAVVQDVTIAEAQKQFQVLEESARLKFMQFEEEATIRFQQGDANMLELNQKMEDAINRMNLSLALSSSTWNCFWAIIIIIIIIISIIIITIC